MRVEISLGCSIGFKVSFTVGTYSGSPHASDKKKKKKSIMLTLQKSITGFSSLLLIFCVAIDLLGKIKVEGEIGSWAYCELDMFEK